MMSAMVGISPSNGSFLSHLRALFERNKPSPDLQGLKEATDKVEDAADKMIAVAKRIESTRRDPLGDLVDGLREGPAQRTKKKKATRKRPT